MANKIETILVAAAIIVLVTGFASGQAHEVLPPEVTKALVEQGEVLSPITVRSETRRETRLSKAKIKEELDLLIPVEQFLRDHTSVVTLSSGGKVYSGINVGRDGRYSTESAFDGDVLYTGMPPQSREVSGLTAPSVLMQIPERVELVQPAANWFYFAYFEAAGFYPYRDARHLAEHMPPQSTILYLLDHGGELVNVSNQEAGLLEVVIKAPPLVDVAIASLEMSEVERRLEKVKVRKDIIEESLRGLTMRRQSAPISYVFTLDPSRSFALVETTENSADGRMLTHTKNSNFRRVADRDLWLPMNVVKQFSVHSSRPETISSRPIYEDHTKVTDLSPIATEAQFVIRYNEPGTLISDQTGSRIVETVVAADGKELDRTLAALPPVESRASVGRLLLGLLAVVMALLVLAFFIRRRRFTRGKTA